MSASGGETRPGLLAAARTRAARRFPATARAYGLARRVLTGKQTFVVAPFRLHPAILPTSDWELRADPRTALNQICDISDWRHGPVADLMTALGEHPLVYRKAWEEAKCIHGLQRLGVITPEARGLSVGAGTEKPLFWLANEIKEIVATDLYQDEDEWSWGTDFVSDPAKYAPFPFRQEALTVLQMSGTDLRFEDDSFDFVYTLSSIEHFGGHEAAARAMDEMARVVKTGGIVCVVTELLLSKAKEPGDYFTFGEIQDHILLGHGLSLVEPHIDLRISRSLVAYPFRTGVDHDLAVSPHIVLMDEDGAVWTSLILFFRK